MEENAMQLFEAIESGIVQHGDGNMDDTCAIKDGDSMDKAEDDRDANCVIEEDRGSADEAEDDKDATWVVEEDMGSADEAEDDDKDATWVVEDGESVDEAVECDSTSSDTQIKEQAKKCYLPGQRKRRRCSLCGMNYAYLSQHLSRRHGVKEPETLKKMMGKARERDPIQHSKKPGRKNVKGYPCPYPGCYIRGLKRLDVHLESQHALKRKGPQYCSLLKAVNFRRGISFKAKASATVKLDSPAATESRYKKPSSESVLSSFEDYIYASNGCNDSARRTAKAAVRNLHLVSQLMGVDIPHLLTPAMPQRIVMCLNEMRKRPGTLIKYLHCMKKFGLFLTLYHDQASALGLPQARLHKTILMLTDFIRSTRPRINARQAELKSQISGLILDGGVVKSCVENIEKELKTMTMDDSRCKEPKWLEVRRLRNLIILKILLSQAPRPGVIENATMKQYRNRTTVVAPETFEEVSTIEVDKHKTIQAGPAILVVNEALGKQLRAYVRYYRPYTLGCQGTLSQFEYNGDSSHLFLGSNGTSVSKISQEAERTWHSFGNEGIRLTPTIIRKTAATKAVRGLSSKDAESVADLMAHKPETQRHYYVASQELKAKVRACNYLTSIMQMEDPDAAPVRRSQNLSSSPPESRSPLFEDKLPDRPQDLSVSSQVEQPDRPQVPVKTFYRVVPEAASFSKKKVYTTQQEELLMAEYKQFLDDGGTGFRYAASFIKDKHKEFDNFTPKQLADKIRHSLDTLQSKEPHSGNVGKTCPRPRLQNVKSDDSLAIRSVSIEAIKQHVKRKFEYLKAIFSGKTESSRHKAYKRGGNSRVDLTYEVYSGEPFSEEQQECILETLMDLFSRGSTEMLDYVMKVLLQEAYVKVCQDILGTTKQEAEELLERCLPN